MIQFEVGKTYISGECVKYTVLKRSPAFITLESHIPGATKRDIFRKKFFIANDRERINLDNKYNYILANWLDESQPEQPQTCSIPDTTNITPADDTQEDTQNAQPENVKFVVGKTYYETYSNLILNGKRRFLVCAYTVIKRTSATVTISETSINEYCATVQKTSRRKIRVIDGVEHITPNGSYYPGHPILPANAPTVKPNFLLTDSAQPESSQPDTASASMPAAVANNESDTPTQPATTDNPGFTVVPSEHIQRPEYTVYPDTITDECTYTVIPACDNPAHNPAAAVVPYADARNIRNFFHILAIYLRLWLAMHITTQPDVIRSHVSAPWIVELKDYAPDNPHDVFPLIYKWQRKKFSEKLKLCRSQIASCKTREEIIACLQRVSSESIRLLCVADRVMNKFARISANSECERKLAYAQKYADKIIQRREKAMTINAEIKESESITQPRSADIPALIPQKQERKEAWQSHSCQYCENDPRPEWTHKQFALGIILSTEYSNYKTKTRYCTKSMSEWLRDKYTLVQLYKINKALGYQLLLSYNPSTKKAAFALSSAIADTVLDMEHYYVCTYEVLNPPALPVELQKYFTSRADCLSPVIIPAAVKDITPQIVKFEVGKSYSASLLGSSRKSVVTVTAKTYKPKDKGVIGHIVLHEESSTTTFGMELRANARGEYVKCNAYSVYCNSWDEIVTAHSNNHDTDPEIIPAKVKDITPQPTPQKLDRLWLFADDMKDYNMIRRKNKSLIDACDSVEAITALMLTLDTTDILNQANYSRVHLCTGIPHSSDHKSDEQLASEFAAVIMKRRAKKLKASLPKTQQKPEKKEPAPASATELDGKLIDTANLHGNDWRNAHRHNISVITSCLFREAVTALLQKVSVSTIREIGGQLGTLNKHVKGNKSQLIARFVERLFEIRSIRNKKTVTTTTTPHNATSKQYKGFKIVQLKNRQLGFIFDE